MKYLALLALLPSLAFAMSEQPDETRTLNKANFTWVTPFERTSGAAMTSEEYIPLQVYVDNHDGLGYVLYQYVNHIVVPEQSPRIERTGVVYTYSTLADIKLTLKDTEGRESEDSPVIHFDFTNPSAPQQTCTP